MLYWVWTIVFKNKYEIKKPMVVPVNNIVVVEYFDGTGGVLNVS